MSASRPARQERRAQQEEQEQEQEEEQQQENANEKLEALDIPFGTPPQVAAKQHKPTERKRGHRQAHAARALQS